MSMQSVVSSTIRLRTLLLFQVTQSQYEMEHNGSYDRGDHIRLLTYLLTHSLTCWMLSFHSLSVYKIDANNEMQIWSHGRLGDGVLRNKGWRCAAAWYDSTTVVTSDSHGDIRYLFQDFP